MNRTMVAQTAVLDRWLTPGVLRVLRWAFVVALIGQLVVLYLPRTPDAVPEVAGVDKVVHVGIFALPVVLAVLLGATRWVIPLLVLHAPVSELVQGYLLPARGMDARDVIADLVGVVLGWGIGALLLRWRSRT